MENRYLKDIKDLNDSFDEYKKQVEKHINQLTKDKLLLQKNNEDMETVIQKLKYNIRSTTHHHEINSKRMREKVARFENEVIARKDEY